MTDTKPNFAALARRYNCDYRTVKRYYELGQEQTLQEASRRNVPPTLIENFKTLINEKVELGCSARSIFYLIQKRGYSGSYVTVRRYVKSCKVTKQHKATVRVETSPGLSAQVDWKENLKMTSKNGEVFTVNIFLYVLGYSRMKYLQLTTSREQPILFDCLNNAFFELGGVPEEIWFDNMKTVVDHSKSQFTHAVFNETFRQYAKDAGFQFQPKLKKTDIVDLHTLRFLDNHDNILFVGNSGVGKTHLAISLALEALDKGHSSYFILSNELVNKLLKAQQRGALERALKQYANYDLLIIDEMGYLPFSRDGATLLFQLINARYEKKSTIITTNIPLSQWSEFLQDKKLTNALLDRLVHHSKVIPITGNSYRMKDYSERKTRVVTTKK
ncbi:IS21 family transposase [Lactococcus allomyrinae]|uniref:IS21 family transposase n=2 Tax=Lactococcus allomyrinae TaxID=2419773 RepID=A0A387BI41_9LACT|nr:IS21-like element helper ATPase IstB [Lactococcus allomyrinae]AYG01882.1 IS21 family transposase [Lactococcus allomyrinae]